VRRAHGEEGIALVSAIILLMVVIGLGLGLMAFSDTQQRSATNEQQNEGAYALAEAALNAQIYELSLQWPSNALNAQSAYPYGCNAATNGTSYCPSPSDLSSYQAGSQACPAGTSGDAWNSSAPSNGWTTYVRDAGSSGSSTQQFFSSTAEKTAASYDASDNGYLWVRAVATVNCHTAAVISKVSAQLVGLNFPRNVLTANGFEINNNGHGSSYVLNNGPSGQPSPVSVRCNGLGSAKGPNTTCTNYQSGQVGPNDNVATTPASPAATLTPTQLESLKAQAIAAGTYWPKAGQACPATMSDLTGAPTYVAGPCTITITGGGTANSQASPGFLVLVNGTIEISGSSTFYGVIYAVNAQGCPPGCIQSNNAAAASDVVYVHGNGQVLGGIDVDGNGTVGLGESHQGNLTYGAAGFNTMKTWGGAAGTPNSFRQLPAGQ